MQLKDLDTTSMDYEGMEILEEIDIPLHADVDEISSNLAIASQFMSAIGVLSKRTETLKEQKQTVLRWFAEQQEKIDKQEEYVKSRLELALYALKENGQAKPKISSWAGTAYLQERKGIDWNGLTATSNELVKIAKANNLEVEVIEKTNLNDIKAVITQEEMKELGIKKTKTTSMVVRKA